MARSLALMLSFLLTGPIVALAATCDEDLSSAAYDARALPADGNIVAPKDWTRVTVSEVMANPYVLAGQGLRVLTRHGQDIAILFPESAYPHVKQSLAGLNDRNILAKWTARAENEISSSVLGLAKLWQNGRLIRDVAFRRFAQRFDESLRGRDTQSGTKVTMVSLSPDAGRSSFRPAAPLSQAAPKWVSPLNKSLVQKRPGVEFADQPGKFLQIRDQRTGAMTVVEGWDRTRQNSNIFSNRTFGVFIEQLVRNYQLPVSDVENPDYLEVFYNSKTAVTVKAYNSYNYLLSMFSYIGDQGEKRVRIDSVERLTLERYLDFYAQDTFDNLHPIKEQFGIFIPASFMVDRTGRVSEEYVERVLKSITDEEKLQLLQMPIGEMRLMKKDWKTYSSHFHILRMEDGLAIVSLY